MTTLKLAPAQQPVRLTPVTSGGQDVPLKAWLEEHRAAERETNAPDALRRIHNSW